MTEELDTVRFRKELYALRDTQNMPLSVTRIEVGFDELSRVLITGHDAADFIDRFIALLPPFVEAANDLDDATRDDSDIWEMAAAMSITAGDLRALKALAHNHSMSEKPNGV